MIRCAGVRPTLCLMLLSLWLFSPMGVLSAQQASPDSAGPTPSSTQPLTQAITLTPHAGCFERPAIEAQVEAWLGSAEVPADIHVFIQGDLEDPRVASFGIERAGALRERRFDHLPLNCADATAVVGLAVALAIDASLLDDWILPSQAPPARPVGPLAAAPAPIVRPRFRLTLQLSASHAAIPGMAGGAKLGLGYAPAPWFSVHMQALTLFSFNNRISGSAGVFDARSVAAAPSLCAGGMASERVRVDLCSGASLGMLQVRGREFLRSESHHGLWSMAMAGLRVVFKGAIHWALDVEAVFPLRVPGVAAADQSNVLRRRVPDAAGVLVSFGPQFHF